MSEVYSVVMGGAHYVIPFIIVLSVVVFVHEFGHYWIARLAGVKIVTFSIGFGGEIFGWNDRHGTRWKVSWLPLGGYVKMFGDADASSARPDEAVKDFSEQEKSVAFFYKSLPKRFAIVAAGPVFNYIFAIIALALLFMLSGQPMTPPVVSDVMEGSAAQKVGFLTGDRVIDIDGHTIDRFEEIKRMVAVGNGATMHVKVKRAESMVDIVVTPDVVKLTDRFGGEHLSGRLGISSETVEFNKRPAGSALVAAVEDTWSMTTSTLKAVGQMIMGTRGTDELGGPLRIAQMSGKVAQDGVASMAWFMAIISINLGLINLFPIPLLDGGTLMFYIFEGILRRPLSESAQEIGVRIGAFLVMCLMLFATWNDLVHMRVISYVQSLFS